MARRPSGRARARARARLAGTAGARSAAAGAPAAAVKPRGAGSSLGVSLVADEDAAWAAAFERAFAHDEVALVEELLSGSEFSVVVIDTERGPLALAPTEIETPGALYDTRAKYLQGEGARLHTPYREAALIEPIRRAAERAYAALGLRDMARIDGFVLPAAEAGAARVLATDVNGISGISLSSFVFLQTSLVGLSHAELVRGLVNRGLERAGRGALGSIGRAGRGALGSIGRAGRGALGSIGRAGRGALEPVGRAGRGALAPVEGAGAGGRALERIHVILGGATSERQVSRQSGIFAGLCLMARGRDVRFVLLDRAGRYTEIGLFLALHHDVEEIEGLVADGSRRAAIRALARVIGGELGRCEADALRHLGVGPTSDLEPAVRAADFVFLALHGGSGEDGTLQAALELLGKPYNGAGPRASRLASDKRAANLRVAALGLPGIAAPAQALAGPEELFALASERDPRAQEARFAALCAELGASALVCKPRADGCSTGVKLVHSGRELAGFLRAVASGASAYRAPGSETAIKLPAPSAGDWLFERALVEELPPALPRGDWNARALAPWFAAKRFVELTCAVLETSPGELEAALPSATIAARAELSLEEKFQQGTGANIALDALADRAACESVRARIATIARALELEGYARIDCFWDKREDQVYLIEANTLCGLTEATVFFTQMLVSFELTPVQALEAIVAAGHWRAARRRPSGSAVS